MQLGTRHKALNTQSGFSLVELTVVLAIIAVVMTSAIALFTVSLEGRAYRTTQARLATLQKALFNYRLAYNRLPCPADNENAISGVYYGVEAAVTGYCKGGTPAADLAGSSGAYGMIPVRTLGLPDEAAFDGWGRRFNYAILPNYALENSFDTIPMGTIEGLTISTTGGTVITTAAAYIIVSHGKNGHGALNGPTAAPVNASSTNANELLNCKCTSTSAANVAADVASFVQGDEKPDPSNAANSFDDMLVFATRTQLAGATE